MASEPAAGSDRRAPSARVEKAVRLTTGSLVAACVGIVAVATGSEVLGFVAVAIILFSILIGPLSARLLGTDR